jgi:hypothetical protein
MKLRLFLVFVCAAMLAPVSSAHAQRMDNSLRGQDTTRTIRSTWRPLRIVKWTSLLASTGAAAYGFAENRVADREYKELELDCDAAPFSCSKVNGGEAYSDPALEQRYQKILKRDDNARMALLAGQIGIAASVIMFIIDLPEGENTEDIPYEPKPLRFGLSRDGRAELGLYLRSF